MNQFADRYKLKSNSELIKILQNSDDYQELALEAARIELSNRGVSEKEINGSSKVIISEVKSYYLPLPLFNKIKSWFVNYSFEDYVILSITNLLGLGAFVSLYLGWEMLRYSVMDINSIDFSFFIFVFLIIVPVAATVLFWKREKYGWILLAILITYSMLDALYKYLDPYYLYNDDNSLGKLVNSIISGLILYLICKPKMREIYRINNKVMTHVIGWTVATIVIVYLFQAN